MFEGMIWGATPSGFKKFSPSPNQLSLLREGFESLLQSVDIIMKEDGAGPSRFVGRERLRLIALPSGELALIRSYRHGGFFRHLTGGIFFTWPPRPFREILVTEEARRRGVPTIEALGALIQRIVGPFYRGWLITRELQGANDFWEVLRTRGTDRVFKNNTLKAAAQSLRAMHEQGVYHHDLNLRNILIRQESDSLRAYIIDFDKGRIFLGHVPRRKVEKNLRRLYRSIRKLDLQRERFSEEDWSEFLRYYQGIDGA